MSERNISGDPGQVLDVLRDVLLEHMSGPEAMDDYQIQTAVFIGRSGRLISNDYIVEGRDVPRGLRLTMRSGAEYNLKLDRAE